MRVFWAVIVVLILAGVGALAFSGGRATQAQRDASAARAKAEAAEAQARAAATVAVPSTPQQLSAISQAIPEPIELPAAPPAASTKAPATTPAHEAPSHTPPLPATTVSPTPATPPIAGTKAPAPTPGPGQHNPGNVKITAPPLSTTPKVEPPADPAAIMPEGVPAKLGDYDVRPVKIETKDDGSLLLDNRFTLRGKGTREEPYRVTWELLVSAKDTFEPAAGLKKIPGRVAMLHDKFIRLDGYVAFPLMMQKPTELLSMLNQWDGCCIGVPPTPYDAVEVKLTKMVTGDARFAVTGGVVGKFKVDPYVVKNPKGDWLVGMYTMNAADFTPEDIGDGAGT